MKRSLALALILAAAPALADTPKPATPHAANQPINVSADNFTVEKSPAQANGGVINGTYSGNVVVIQGDTRLRADTVRILVVDGHAEKAFANGHIVIDSPNSGTATGDSGVYEIGPRVATLNGHVVLTKEKNVMRGAQLTVNLATGVARLGGGTAATGGGRVQGSFTPPAQQGGGK